MLLFPSLSQCFSRITQAAYAPSCHHPLLYVLQRDHPHASCWNFPDSLSWFIIAANSQPWQSSETHGPFLH